MMDISVGKESLTWGRPFISRSQLCFSKTQECLKHAKPTYSALSLGVWRRKMMRSDSVPRQLRFLHAPLIWPLTTPPHVPFNKIFFLIYSDWCPKPLLPNQVPQLILHHNDQCKNGLVTQGKPIQSLQKTSLQDRWPLADWVAMLGVCESGAVSACEQKDRS